MSAPDRIWAWAKSQRSFLAYEDKPGGAANPKEYLLSTPAREHAEEMQTLLLDLMADQKSRFGNNTIYPRLTAILSKIDTGETDATNQRNSSQKHGV